MQRESIFNSEKERENNESSVYGGPLTMEIVVIREVGGLAGVCVRCKYSRLMANWLHLILLQLALEALNAIA